MNTPKKPCLRVLIIAPSSIAMVGGQEVESMLLMRQWENDPEVEAIFVPNNPALPRWLKRLKGIRYVRTAVRLPVYLASVWRASSQVDVLHVFSAPYSSFLLNCLPVWIISRLRRKRFVLNYHTAREWHKFASSSLVRFVLKRTEEIVVPSEYLAARFEQLGFKAIVVPNVIDTARFRYRRRVPLRPILICTRNLNPEYGIEIVIHAFAIVQQHYTDATLYLIGDGPLRKDLETLVRTLGVARVFFCGAVANEIVAGWHEQADIFVNASFVDNAPLSILEAMASGMPVVTTAAGGIPFIVSHEETGFLCPVGDSASLAEQIMRPLREPELALSIARRANEQVSACGWSLVRTKWLEAYCSRKSGLAFRKDILDSDQQPEHR